MVNPCPGYSISTPYWKAGSAWGCGYHDGVDYASPSGTDVVAAWGGTVVEVAYPTSFGPAFGRSIVIDHDKLPDGSAGGWGLYAHLSAENVSVGQRVEAGQKIGDVGTTGNSSGNHLHFGIYMTDHWTSCGGKNPDPWIKAGTDVANYKYKYLGKPEGTQVIGQSYVDLDLSFYDPSVEGWENSLVYINVQPTNWIDSKEIAGMIRIRMLRIDEGNDETAHEDWPIVRRLKEDGTLKLPGGTLDEDGRTLRRLVYWELADGGKTKFQVKCEGGLTKATLHTRYTKKAIVL
jgi:murein DD-endopeptidase MepM/ murein hydrolase activator NlpD